LIHVVDLDGARGGGRRNHGTITAIRQAVDCPLEVGGGIRSIEDAEALFAIGVDRVIMGTVAVQDPLPVEFLAGRYPGRVIIGADGRGGKVAMHGWQEVGERDIYQFAASFNHLRLGGVLFTDIDTDGALVGPNIEAQRRMGEGISNPLIASGGISDIEDLCRLARAGIRNLFGVVVGTALYEQRFSLSEAIREVGRCLPVG
jgi:phosphoribosylformimino-5-aminoimidazole carboxamide ribotide isomerase